MRIWITTPLTVFLKYGWHDLAKTSDSFGYPENVPISQKTKSPKSAQRVTSWMIRAWRATRLLIHLKFSCASGSNSCIDVVLISIFIKSIKFYLIQSLFRCILNFHCFLSSHQQQKLSFLLTFTYLVANESMNYRWKYSILNLYFLPNYYLPKPSAPSSLQLIELNAPKDQKAREPRSKVDPNSRWKHFEFLIYYSRWKSIFIVWNLVRHVFIPEQVNQLLFEKDTKMGVNFLQWDKW